jgi:hypothetical protein
MADTPPFLPRPVRRMGLGVAGDADIERMIAVEMPVSIEVQGLAYAVMIRQRRSTGSTRSRFPAAMRCGSGFPPLALRARSTAPGRA